MQRNTAESTPTDPDDDHADTAVSEADAAEQRQEVAPEPQDDELEPGLESPDADAAAQARPVSATQRQWRPSIDDEVPEADALDQAREVPLDDDYDHS